MIIAIADDNGGTAKSILATNLAARRAAGGRRVLLVDGNSRRLSQIWSEQRHAAGTRPAIRAEVSAGSNIAPQLEDLVAHYDDVVIDTGEPCHLSTRTALAFADRVIVPLQADDFTHAMQDRLRKQLASARLSNPRLDALFVIVSPEPEIRLAAIAEARAFIVTITKATLADESIHLGPSLYQPFARGAAISEWQTADERTARALEALYRRAFSIDGRSLQRQQQTISRSRLGQEIARLGRLIFKLLP